MPAVTFSDESVDWMVTAITAGDLTATSAWVTVSTTEATPSCKAISPAGIVIDAIRAAKIALDRGIGGPLWAPSAYFMKSPPVQMVDKVAREKVEAFIDGADNAKPKTGGPAQTADIED